MKEKAFIRQNQQPIVIRPAHKNSKIKHRRRDRSHPQKFLPSAVLRFPEQRRQKQNMADRQVIPDTGNDRQKRTKYIQYERAQVQIKIKLHLPIIPYAFPVIKQRKHKHRKTAQDIDIARTAFQILRILISRIQKYNHL